MIRTPLQQLRDLQMELYEKAYGEARSVVVGTSKAILSYSAKFEASLPENVERSTLTAMLEVLRRKQFILFGDFHTLRQSQRGFMRLMRAYQERLRDQKIVVALEMFKARDQRLLDVYMSGQMDEAEFLEAIDYEQNWGFPWHNFKMILDFAKVNGFPVVGINSSAAGRDPLAQRDKFSAQVLVNVAEEYPDHKIFCLIGEYHLGDHHLPLSLGKEIRSRGGTAKVMRILCNTDRYYFSLQKQNDAKSTEFLKLRSDYFCVINSPPWMKWHSFSIWEEMRNLGFTELADTGGDFNSEIDIFTEENYDFDYQFLDFLKRLKSFLGLTVEDVDLENFHIAFSKEGGFVADVATVYDDEMLVRQIIQRAITDGVYFLGPANKVLLTYISVNNFAEAAGQYLHRLVTGFHDGVDDEAESFYRRVIKAAIGMVASKVLNPRRKCATIQTARQFVRRYHGRQLDGHGHLRRETARALLKHHDWMNRRLSSDDGKFLRPPRSVFALDLQANFEVSRDIGQMLGFNLYTKVLSNRVRSEEMRRLFETRYDHWDVVWEEVFRLYSFL